MTSRTPQSASGTQPHLTLGIGPFASSVSASSATSASSTLTAAAPSFTRSSHRRTLSLQHLQPLSASDPASVPSISATPTSRRQGCSHLQLELSSDLGPPISNSTESPRSLSAVDIAADTAVDSGIPISALSHSATSVDDPNNTPLPFPHRLANFDVSSSDLNPRATRPVTARSSCAASQYSRKDARPRPYSLEPPRTAPRYPTVINPDLNSSCSSAPSPPGTSVSGLLPLAHSPARSAVPGSALSPTPYAFADFFPWSGNHVEDHFTESVIKKGYFDTNPISQADSSTSRSAVLPVLKHKTGLSIISAVLVDALNQRRYRGQITAPSTFKPPPRVTLTDTKREAWLKDLANPAISLRRLSRTIPHGIRGKQLLHHCLSKNVPPDRAAWLVKCVGANETRSFRRKGVGAAAAAAPVCTAAVSSGLGPSGEAKWIREWSVCVEQFVDVVVASFAQSDWKVRATYALRLASDLYVEHLLERDHYLEWVVTGVENCSLARLPMWILIAQIVWGDLFRMRRFASRLVFALLEHASVIKDDLDRDASYKIFYKLQGLLTTLVKSNPESLICPSNWARACDTLRLILPPGDQAAQRAFASLHVRNTRLGYSGRLPASAFVRREELVRLLDETVFPLASPAIWSWDRAILILATKCLDLKSDMSMAMSTLLSWSVTPLRPGLTKIYVAAQVLRKLSDFGVDVTASILEYLDDFYCSSIPRPPPSKQAQNALFYLLVSELVRSNHFIVSRYYQWVIARGGLLSPADLAPDGAPSTRLLVEIPPTSLSESLGAVRVNILRRAGYDIRGESQDVAIALALVDRAAAGPHFSISGRTIKLARLVSLSSRVLQTAVGVRVRELFVDCYDDEKFAGRITEPGSSEFRFARTILEHARDITTLVQVLFAFLSRAKSYEVLVSCVDTISLHLDALSILNEVRPLYDTALDRFRALAEQLEISAARPALDALDNLAMRLPDTAVHSTTATQLARDLVIPSQPARVYDICSPVSEDMAAQRTEQDANSFCDEVDEVGKRLAAGSSLDRPSMDRLFDRITARFEDAWCGQSEHRRPVAKLIARLRMFDPVHFDERVAEWLPILGVSICRGDIAALYSLLICTDCLTIAAVVQFAMNFAAEGASADATYLQEVLGLVITPLPPRCYNLLSPDELYRFRLRQNIAQADAPVKLLELISGALCEYGRHAQETGFENPLDRDSYRVALVDQLQQLVLRDCSAVARALAVVAAQPSAATHLLNDMIARLLDPLNSSNTDHFSLDSILALANELSLPFCQLKLSLSLTTAAPDQAETPADALSHAMERVMDHATDLQVTSWIRLLPGLGEEVTQFFRSRIQVRFLDLFPAVCASSESSAPPIQMIPLARRLLSASEAVACICPPSVIPSTVADRLADLWILLATRDDGRLPLRSAIFAHWLPLLVRFVAVVYSTAAPDGQKTEVCSRILISLSGLMLELQAMSCQAEPPVSAQVDVLAEQVFDLALVLADRISDEARAACARILLATSSDPRLLYLLSQPVPSDGLALAARDPHDPHAAVVPFVLRRWELLKEPTPNISENDTSLSLTLFDAIRIQ